MTFTPEELQELKRKAAAVQPTLRIGKSGLTDGVIAETNHQLEHRGLVKLKLLKAMTETQDRHAVAQELAAKTGSTVVHMVGGIVTFAKKPGREHSAPFARRRVSRFTDGEDHR